MIIIIIIITEKPCLLYIQYSVSDNSFVLLAISSSGSSGISMSSESEVLKCLWQVIFSFA